MIEKRIRPRKIKDYEFFDSNVEVCDIVRSGGVGALDTEDRVVVEWFIETVKGTKKVLDLGCGSGFPGLYVAPYVGELIGVDAVPGMVDKARSNARMLNAANVEFEKGGTDGLRFADEEFDGIILCGLLESMDWESVHSILPEVHRVLKHAGIVAVLDRDWRYVLDGNPLSETLVRFEDNQLIIQFIERKTSPNLERDIRYLIDPRSDLGQRLLRELQGKSCIRISINSDDLEPEAILDSWYDETAQFDADTLRELFVSVGFCKVEVNSMAVWGGTLFLTAIK